MSPWTFRESPLVDGPKSICTPGGAGVNLPVSIIRAEKTCVRSWTSSGE
jgi:hypothetical protein